MNPELRRLKRLRRAAVLCAALVLAITTLSVYLRLTQAGLGCTPWPACYGAALRAAQSALPGEAVPLPPAPPPVAAARLAHRVSAVSALVVVIVMLAWAGRRPRLGAEAAQALALLALAVGLAVLGRYTAGARMPAVAVGNVLGGVVMLALAVRLAAPGGGAPPLRAAARLAAALVLVQIALGALVSASYAGASCASLGDCLREVQAAGWPWDALDPWREPQVDATPRLPLNPAGALAQLAHRAFALPVALAVALLAWRTWRAGAAREAAGVAALLVLQGALGFMAGAGLPLGPAVMHNVAAALLLAAAVRHT